MELDEILLQNIPIKEKPIKEGIGQALNNAAGNLINQAGSAMSGIGQVSTNALQSLGKWGSAKISNALNVSNSNKLIAAIKPIENALTAYIKFVAEQEKNAPIPKKNDDPKKNASGDNTTTENATATENASTEATAPEAQSTNGGQAQ